MPNAVPLATAFIALAAIAATWIAGSLLHWRNLTMIWATIAVVLAAAAIIAGWWLWRRRRGAGPVASPEGLRLLRQQWRQAMASLREAGVHGQVAGRLPWFLVIGPPGSGKSSMLANSGLGFSTVGGTSTAAGEIAPTGTFTMWRSQDAVFIDVAGRYLSDAKSRGEWLALLRLIRGERHGLPVQGVILAKPLAEQFRGGLSAAAVEANLVRDRLQELADVTGAAVPTYVMVTKADLLGGFKEFFAAGDRAERDAVLGLTMPWPPPADPAQGFAAEYGRLVDSLCDRRLAAMAAAPGEVAQRKLMQFPAQMRAVLPYLTDYLAIAVRPVPGHLPGFRGLYFSSALPVTAAKPTAAPVAPATPAAPVAGKTAAQPEGTLFLTAAPAATAAAPAGTQGAPGAAAASFVRDLLARVVVPDACLARPTPRALRRWRTARAACLVIAPLLAAAAALWTGWSAWRGVRLVEAMRAPCAELVEAKQHQRPEAAADPTERLLAIDRLGTALAAVVRHDGEGLRPAAEAAAALYVRALREVLLDACVAAVGADLTAMRSGPQARGSAQDEIYDLFRAYQMLGGTLQAQSDVAVRALLAGRRWFRGVDPKDGPAEYRIEALARRQLDICAETLMPAGLVRVEIDRTLVDALNRELGEGLWIQQAYDDIIRQLTPQFGVVQPETLLAGPARAALTTSTSVSLVYGQAAWDSAVVHAIEDKADALGRTFAGLNMSFDRAAIVRRLGERYVEDHNRRWLAFIAGVRAAQVRDFRDTPEQIERICGPSSPYPEFIAQALDRLSLKTVGVQVPWGRDTAWVKPSLQAVSELRKDALDYVQATQDGRRSTDVERLKALVERFNAVSARIGELLVNVQPSEKREAIHKGFDSILHSLFAALDQEVAGELDRLWTERVHTTFSGRLASRFPFARDAVEDVPMAEFEAFFNPVTGTMWSTLAQIETMRGIRVLGRPSVTLSGDYERMVASAKAIRTLFFGGASESLKLQFPYRMQQREGVRDMQVQFGARTNSLYERPDARYTAEIKRGDPYGAKVAIQTVTGQWRSSENNRGDWGFLRLLRSGNPKAHTAGGHLCTWEHDGSAAGKSLTFKASIILESGGIEQAVVGDLLSGLDLPARILAKPAR